MVLQMAAGNYCPFFDKTVMHSFEVSYTTVFPYGANLAILACFFGQPQNTDSSSKQKNGLAGFDMFDPGNNISISDFACSEESLDWMTQSNTCKASK